MAFWGTKHSDYFWREYYINLTRREVDTLSAQLVEASATTLHEEQCRIALERAIKGESWGVSSSIADTITYGFGELDSNGVWEYPLPEWVVETLKHLRAQLVEARGAIRDLLDGKPPIADPYDEFLCKPMRAAWTAKLARLRRVMEG